MDAELRRIAGHERAGVYAYLQPEWGWGLNNTGAIVGEHTAMVVDTCFTAARTARFRSALRAVCPREPSLLANTHHHGDHTFGNYQFEGATVIAHRACRQAVIAEGLAVQQFFPDVVWGGVRVCPPALTFTDRLTVHVDALTVELIALGPAHTVGDVVVWVPDLRTLFTGDIVFDDRTPFVRDGSLANLYRVLDELRALDAAVVVPGHGPVCGPGVFDKNEAYLRWLDQTAREGFAAGLSPLQTAQQADLGPYRDWGEPERIVANIARAYSELRGEPLGTPLDRKEIAPMMIAYNGGPMRCHA